MIEQKKEEAKEHHLDGDALIPHNVAQCRAFRPWSMDHLLLEDQWLQNGERGKLIGDATSRNWFRTCYELNNMHELDSKFKR